MPPFPLPPQQWALALQTSSNGRQLINITAIPLTMRLPAHPKPSGFCTVSFSDSPPFDAVPIPAPSPGAGGRRAAFGLHRAKATPGVGWENRAGLRGTQCLCNCAESPSLTQPRALPKPPPFPGDANALLTSAGSDGAGRRPRRRWLRVQRSCEQMRANSSAPRSRSARSLSSPTTSNFHFF